MNPIYLFLAVVALVAGVWMIAGRSAQPGQNRTAGIVLIVVGMLLLLITYWSSAEIGTGPTT